MVWLLIALIVVIALALLITSARGREVSHKSRREYARYEALATEAGARHKARVMGRFALWQYRRDRDGR